jgi:hypothetical protein
MTINSITVSFSSVSMFDYTESNQHSEQTPQNPNRIPQIFHGTLKSISWNATRAQIDNLKVKMNMPQQVSIDQEIPQLVL